MHGINNQNIPAAPSEHQRPTVADVLRCHPRPQVSARDFEDYAGAVLDGEARFDDETDETD